MDKSTNGDHQACGICSTRKHPKGNLDATPGVEIDCPQKHRFCQSCILTYSRIKSDCPLCGKDYGQMVSLEDGAVIRNSSAIPDDDVSSLPVDEELTSQYLEYLETITAISSEEEDEKEDAKANDDRSTLAERLIRRRMKKLKSKLNCEGVACESSGCSIPLHAQSSLFEPIEQFEVDNFDWKEPSLDSEEQRPRVLRREKTYEELLEECEKIAEEAIIEEGL